MEWKLKGLLRSLNTGIIVSIPATWFQVEKATSPTCSFDKPARGSRYKGQKNNIIHYAGLTVGISKFFWVLNSPVCLPDHEPGWVGLVAPLMLSWLLLREWSLQRCTKLHGGRCCWAQHRCMFGQDADGSKCREGVSSQCRISRSTNQFDLTV